MHLHVNGNLGGSSMDLTKLKSTLIDHHQDHLLRFWDQLSDTEKSELFEDLSSIDFREMNTIFYKSVHSEEATHGKRIDQLMEPIEDEFCDSVNRASEADLTKYNLAAMEAVARNEIGVLLLAGGQGTRLGVSYPKGMYDIGLPSHKTLYQIQVERILRLQELSQICTGKTGKIMMYIMTSEHTKRPTEEFFEKHNYFGLLKDQVIFFEQRMIPCFDLEGKIILETKSKVARAPDGNGGLYWALKHENILQHMKESGVKYLHVYCVDNVLVKVADPIFMGFCIDKGAESGNKVVEKSVPTEAVGVVCKVEGRVQVVEYSEIGDTNAYLKNPNGKLVYNAGNICNHFFSTDFLDRVSNLYNDELPYHVAKKKIPFFCDVEGKTITPTSTNGIKLEKFVFDVFRFSDSFVVWECRREEEFSPLKNSEGALQDTPTTARNALFALHKAYIERSGGSVVLPKEQQNGEQAHNGVDHKMAEESSHCICEISPLISYSGENLQKFLKENNQFVSPVLFSEE